MVDLVKAREKARKEKEERERRKAAESAANEPASAPRSEPAATEVEGPELTLDDADTLELEPAGPAASLQPPAASKAEPALHVEPPAPSAPSAPPAPSAPAAPDDADSPAPAETTAGRCLAFVAGNETYGVAIESIDEIIPIQPVTMVPTAPDVVAGIMSLRGRIVTVIDARRRLGHEPREFTPESRVIVIRHGGELFGLQVDSVRQVVSVPEEKVEPIASVVAAHAEPCLRGVYHREPEKEGGRAEMLILVDLEKFLEISA